MLVLHRLGFQNFVSVPLVGLRGGIGLFWRLHFDFDIMYTSANSIAILVHPCGELAGFLMVFVYGPARWQEKILFGRFLSQLVSQGPPSWVCYWRF